MAGPAGSVSRRGWGFRQAGGKAGNSDLSAYYGVTEAFRYHATQFAFSGVTAVVPVTTDLVSLGTTALNFSDLFLDLGAVINFDSGDVTITHSANLLAFAGATSGYTVDARLGPATNDGAALGVSGTAWADLFLASGAVINFAAANITLTHTTGYLTLAGGPLVIPAGSAAAPSIAILGSLSTGMYSSAGNSLDFTAGGALYMNLSGGEITTYRPIALARTAAATWDGTLGAQLRMPTQTINDAGSNRTVAAWAAVNLGIQTLTATNTVTLTDAATLCVIGAPAQSGTLTITRPYSIWVQAGISRFDAAVQHGYTGVVTGTATFYGTTSGVVTLTVAADAGTWTMTLPITGGTSGYSLTTNGSGVTTWTNIASVPEAKDFLPESMWLKPRDALDRILGTRIPAFHYKPGKGTGDTETLYHNVRADWSPWAMHYGGGVFNPANAFGHTVLAFQAVDAEIKELKERIAVLEASRV